MQENKVPQKKIILSLILSFLFCFPISGFIWGFCSCSDCGFNILGRFFMGLVGIVTATLAFGHDVETGTTITSIYILDLVVFILLNLIFYKVNKRRLN